MKPPSTLESGPAEEHPLERRVVMLATKQTEKVQELAKKNYVSFSAQLRMVLEEGLRHVNGG